MSISPSAYLLYGCRYRNDDGKSQCFEHQQRAVRAHVSSEGDITLTNISAAGVAAENITGDILFDGELRPGGFYRLSSMRGTISIRIPIPSNFTLVATAPSTRSINLAAFDGGSMHPLGNGRRIVGKSGDGSASLQVTNQQGSIQFIRR